jgi:hypothetical protein
MPLLQAALRNPENSITLKNSPCVRIRAPILQRRHRALLPSSGQAAVKVYRPKV